MEDCSLEVKYVPVVSGYHTVAVIAKTVETQTVQTDFISFVRGGTFSILYEWEESVPIPWNATETELSLALEGMDSFDCVTVLKQSLDAMNNIYVITFNSIVGDIPALKINISNHSLV